MLRILSKPRASISRSNTVSTRGIIACTGWDATNSSVNSWMPARRRSAIADIMKGRQNFASSSVFAVLYRSGFRMFEPARTRTFTI